MKFLFDNESFSFEALRTAGYACYGGADLGEVLVTARGIPEGDEAAWHERWKTVAERLHSVGANALRTGHQVSAREAMLRSYGYYRAADFYLRSDPAHDPEVELLGRRVRETFAAAAALLDHPAEPVAIPFEGRTLPGYLFSPDDSGESRPTIIYHGGHDSLLEEAYFAAAAGAVRRGFNCLAFDGPGQGSVLHDQHVTFRPDWERVVSAAVDFAGKRPEVDGDRLALIGTSFGGFFAARAAAFEYRLAACVLHDAIFDAHGSAWRILPPGVVDAAMDGRDEVVIAALAGPMAESTGMRWFVRNGMWAFGAGSPAALIRATAGYTLDGVADQIRCPTLVLEAEKDATFHGEAQRVARALTCEYEHILLTDAEGAGEHCHEGAMLAFHQHAFDWLDTVLAR
jgi:alpha-beta hydrolase superfamily lysophospholipase